jgi:hypothetical protein
MPPRTAPSVLGDRRFAPRLHETATVAASGAALTLAPYHEAQWHHITLTANCALTLPAAAAGKELVLVLKQDGTGSRTVTWPAAVKWPAATAPSLSTGAGRSDVVVLRCVDGTTWLAQVTIDLR